MATSLLSDEIVASATGQNPDESWQQETIDSNAHRRSTVSVPVVGTQVHYFGDYQLLEEIGRGGMGVVYKARQTRLNRTVALKMILAGQFAGPAEVQRFHTEAEAAAQLDHPGIVPIFEVGEHDGHHFFSMGLVSGDSLARRLTDGPLAPRVAADMVRRIADAVQFAHDKGVIHRDLKPANILLDEDSQPRLTDFGLAKKVQSDSQLTTTGQILGTPGYMPPEQATGQIREVGPSTDVYSLGAVLFAILTGRPPFQADNPIDTLMQVVEREPVSPRTLNASVPIDLETICLKCLNKDRRHRYQTASELGDELQRFLEGRPLLARPISRSAAVWRWCKRNPIVASLSVALMLSLIVGTIGSSWFAVESHRAASAESDARQDAEEKQKAAEALAIRNAELAAAERQSKEELERINTRLRLDNALHHLHQGELLEGMQGLAGALDGPDKALDDAVRANLAIWEPMLHRMVKAERLDATVTKIFPSGDDDRVALLLSQNQPGQQTLRMWGARRDSALTLSSQMAEGRLSAVTLSNNFQVIFTGTSSGLLRRYPAKFVDGEADAKPIASVSRKVFQGPIDKLIVSPDGATVLVVSGQTRTAQLVDAVDLKPIGRSIQTQGWISSVAFAPDGHQVFVGTGGGEGFTHRGRLLIWNTGTKEQAGEPIDHPGRILALGISPDARILAIGGSDGSVVLWNRTQRLPTGVRIHHDTEISHVRFSPDAQLIVTADTDGNVLITEVASGEELGRLPQQPRLTALSFLPKSEHLLTASTEKVLRQWSLKPLWSAEAQTNVGHPSSGIFLDEPGRYVHAVWPGTESDPARWKSWRLDTFDPDQQREISGSEKSHVVVSHDLRRAVLWQRTIPGDPPNFDLRLRLLDLASNQMTVVELPELKPRQQKASARPDVQMLSQAQFSPSSDYLVVASQPVLSRRGAIRIVRTETAELVGDPIRFVVARNALVLREGLRFPMIRFDERNDRVMIGTLDGVSIRRLSDGGGEVKFSDTPSITRDMAFSSTGQQVAVAADHEVRLYAMNTQAASRVTPTNNLVHPSTIRQLVFTDGDSLLATVSDDRVVRFWNTVAGTLKAELPPHPHRISRIVFSPQGDLFAVVCDQKVFLWHLASRRRIGPVIRLPTSVDSIEFTPDGESLVISGKDDFVRRWNVGGRWRKSATETLNHVNAIAGSND